MAMDDAKQCVAVIGAGSFGTAVAWMLRQAGHDVRMWCYEKSDADYINATHRNPLFLSNLRLDGVVASNQTEETVRGCDSVIIITPSFAVRPVSEELARCLPGDTPVAVLSKGLDSKTGSTLYEAATNILGNEDRIMQVLVILMVIDYVLGCVCALTGHSPKTESGHFLSKVAFAGILKKGVIMLVILVAAQLDMALGRDGTIMFRSAAEFFYIATEGISIIEDAGLIGIPVPRPLKQALEALRDENDGEKPEK